MYSRTDRFMLALALLIIGLASSALHFPIMEAFLSLMVLFTPLWFLKFVRAVYHVKTQAAYELKLQRKKELIAAKRKAIEDSALKRLDIKKLPRTNVTIRQTYRNNGPR